MPGDGSDLTRPLRRPPSTHHPPAVGTRWVPRQERGGSEQRLWPLLRCSGGGGYLGDGEATVDGQGEAVYVAQQFFFGEGEVDRVAVGLVAGTAGGPVDLDHVAGGVVEVEGEGDTVVEGEFDREA